MTLTQDLVCQGSTLILDSAVLILNNHRVICPQPNIRCIWMIGTGSQLWNGTVQGGDAEGIVLDGQGHHVVANVDVAPIESALLVHSDGNALYNVRAESSHSPAFAITGSGNTLCTVRATCPVVAAGGCIDILGNRNVLTGATVMVSEDILASNGAVRVMGPGNWVVSSTITNQDGPAVIVDVGATGNVVWTNTLTGVGPDAIDDNGDCAHNWWGNNRLDAAQPRCLLPSVDPEQTTMQNSR